jgi:hypothetical protein
MTHPLLYTTPFDVSEIKAGIQKIADAPAWGAPDRWEQTPTEVRQLARRLLAKLREVQ